MRFRWSDRASHQWERYAALDPYYAVLTAPEWHREHIDSAKREQFFATGRRSVERLATAIEAQTGVTLEGARALDFGCGVGRLTLALAERCEHAYGVDVSPSMLREADLNAKHQNVTNVEWAETGRLTELSGHYDVVLSEIALQHIPVREGERIFATLVRGLRAGGAGAVGVTLRPRHPLGGALRRARRSLPLAPNVVNLVKGLKWSHPYMEGHSYSLDRLGALLADEGVSEWHVLFNRARSWKSLDYAIVIFGKD